MTFQQLRAWPRCRGPTLCFCTGQSKVGHTAGRRPHLLPGSRVLDEPAQPTLNPLRISKGTILDTQLAFGAGGSPTALG